MTLHMDWMYDVSKRAIEKACGTLWPSRSILTNRPAGNGACLNPEDFRALSFITGSICQRCGIPQDMGRGDDLICPACHARSPAWQSARAALIYDDHAARPILALKRAGRRDGLSTMAGWMQRAASDILDRADVIAAVPLHRSRLAQRGYNQAIWLGAALARRSDLPFEAELLRRKRNTRSQGGLSARARHRNVAGAFDVLQRRTLDVAGRNIVLVDDVLTTGATVTACVTALKRAKARRVDVVTVARVVHDRDITI